MTAQDGFIDDHGAHTPAGSGTVGSESVAIVEDDLRALEPTVISVNEAVRLLRSTLKNRYPDVRFKVRVTHGMERSIDIEWTGGPLADEVVAIARDYIGAGYRRGSLRGTEGKDVDQPGRVMGAEGHRYDVSGIGRCRLKADGSVDTNRVMQANGIE